MNTKELIEKALEIVDNCDAYDPKDVHRMGNEIELVLHQALSSLPAEPDGVRLIVLTPEEVGRLETLCKKSLLTCTFKQCINCVSERSVLSKLTAPRQPQQGVVLSKYPRVDEIVKAYLVQHGFDGLQNDAGCGCDKDDLIPCGENCGHCTVGFKSPCDCGDHDWHIGQNDAKLKG